MFKIFTAPFVALAMLTMMLSGGTAEAAPDKVTYKSYVCKYVGKPSVDERLQTGQNPIWVSNSSLGIGVKTLTTVGQVFNDAQGKSVVIVANTAKLTPEPSVAQCPAPVGPPVIVPPTPTPTVPTATPSVPTPSVTPTVPTPSVTPVTPKPTLTAPRPTKRPTAAPVVPNKVKPHRKPQIGTAVHATVKPKRAVAHNLKTVNGHRATLPNTGANDFNGWLAGLGLFMVAGGYVLTRKRGLTGK